MKRKDIRAGVVYAQRATYPPSAVVFLEDGAATVWRDLSRYGAPYASCGKGDKPVIGTRSSSSQGYAVVRINSFSFSIVPAEVLLGDLDCKSELELFKSGLSPSRSELTFDLIFSLAQISGTYAEAIRDYEKKISDEAEARIRRNEEELILRRRLSSVCSGFNSLGIKAGTDFSGSLTMDIENAERVLLLLRGSRSE